MDEAAPRRSTTMDRTRLLAVSRALDERRTRMEADAREVQQLAKAAHASSSALRSGEDLDASSASRWLFARAHGVGRRFTSRVDRGDASLALKKAMSDELPRSVKKLPMQGLFTAKHVTQACRRADGLQPHLVAPEKGMRNVIRESLNMVHVPARTCVDSVKLTLQNAAAKAVADVLGTAGAAVANNPMQQSAQKQIDSYAKDAAETVRILVEMEAEYPTASFFQQRIANRTSVSLDDGSSDQVIALQSLNDSDSEVEVEEVEQQSSARKRTKEEQQELPDHPATALQGYLEKMSSHPPHLWQKRYFLLSESRKKLFYFKSPEELPHYRGIIDLSDCVVQEVSHEGHGEKSRESLPTGATVSLLFSIAHQDVSKAVSKERNNILLRADNAASKFEWMARLRALTVLDPSEAYLMSAMNAVSLQDGGKSFKQKKEKQANSNGQYIKKAVPISSMYDLTLIDSNTEERMAQLGSDMAEYVWNACKRLSTTIPKAIVHCLIEPSKANLVDYINAAIVDLPIEHIQAMSQNVVSESPHKNAAQAMLDRLERAHNLVKQNLMVPEGDKEVSLPEWVLELADLPGHASDDETDSTHSPLKEGGGRQLQFSADEGESSRMASAASTSVPSKIVSKPAEPVSSLEISKINTSIAATGKRMGEPKYGGASISSSPGMNRGSFGTNPQTPANTMKKLEKKNPSEHSTGVGKGRAMFTSEPLSSASIIPNGTNGRDKAMKNVASVDSAAVHPVRSTPPRRKAPAPPQASSDHLLDM